MQITIKKITVLHRKGTVDYVWIDTELPPPFPAHNTTPLCLTFQLPANTGEKYIRQNFHQEPDEVIQG